MKVLFTGGGTAGHVSPAIAIAEILEKNNMLEDCMFVGRCGGNENNEIQEKGYKLSTIDISPIPRKISVAAVRGITKMMKARSTARTLISDFSPDVVIATGGYVSYPVLKESIKLGIPSVIHESNAYPGAVTKMLGPKCKSVLLGMSTAKKYLKKCNNIIVCGNPIKQSFKKLDYLSARKSLGIKDYEKLIVSFGGSGGADKINESVIKMLMDYSLNDPHIRHIHATGRRSYKTISSNYQQLTNAEDSERCKIVPYIDNMPYLLAAADVAITRSGAMTVAELADCDVPSILIPSPNVAANHQYYNALWAREKFGAWIIEEKDLTVENLIQTAKEILSLKRKKEGVKNEENHKNAIQTEKMILYALKRIKTL